MTRLPLTRLLIVLASLMLGSLPARSATITYWEEERPEIQKALDDFAQEYMKAHPGTTVKRSHFPTEDLRTQFQTASLGGGGPDLLLAPNDFGGVFATMGVVQAVDGFGDMARFDDGVMKAIEDQGKHWGIPLNKGNHLILFFNKAVFPEAPATLEEWTTKGESAAKAKKVPYVVAFNLLEPYWFVPFMGCFGGRPLEGQVPKLDGEAMVKALTFVHDLRYKHVVMPESCDYSCAETLFLEGKAAMTINGDWAIAKYAAKWGANLGMAPLPILAATGKAMTPMNGGKFYLFPSRLKKVQLNEARRFVDFMTSEGVQRRLAAGTKRLPALKSLASDAKLMADPLLVQSAEAAKNAYPMPTQVEMRAVWNAIRPQLQEVMADRGKPEQAARLMQKDAVAKIHSMKQ